MKFFNRLHILIYQISKGKRLGTVAGMPVLVLHTVGRTSGKARHVPLTYFSYEDNYVIIASNGGSNKHPGWFLNLKSVTKSEIEVSGELIQVGVKVASIEEKRKLWSLLISKASMYNNYQRKTTRDIPMVLLNKINPSQSEFS